MSLFTSASRLTPRHRLLCCASPSPQDRSPPPRTSRTTSASRRPLSPFSLTRDRGLFCSRTTLEPTCQVIPAQLPTVSCTRKMSRIQNKVDIGVDKSKSDEQVAENNLDPNCFASCPSNNIVLRHHSLRTVLAVIYLFILGPRPNVPHDYLCHVTGAPLSLA